MDKEAITRLIDVIGEPKLLDVGDGRVPYAVLPQGWKFHAFEELAKAPPRIKEHKQFRTIKSLIEYSQRFIKPQSVIFASLSERKLQVHMDYHTEGGANWDEHVAALTCEKTPALTAWTAWQGKSDVWMTHKRFARLIEDRIDDLVDMEKEGGTKRLDMLQVARTLSVTQEIDVKSAQDLSTGSSQMTCNINNQGRAGSTSNVVIPSEFDIILQPYTCHTESYRLRVRFQYRVKDGVVHMRTELLKLDEMLEQAFSEIGTAISGALDIPLFDQP